MGRLRAPTMASLRALEASHKVHVWDPLPILCPGDTCSAFDGDKPLFVDADHLSAYAGRRLVPSFADQLEAIWGKEPRVLAATGDGP